MFEVNAAVEGGRDASVDSFTEDVTDGLLDLSIDSLVKILIGVNNALSVVISAALFSIELVVNLTCVSAIDWVAIALLEVPVLVHCVVVSSSLTVLSEVGLSLVA